MKRFLTSRVGACALVSTLVIGSTIGWIEAAGGSTEAAGGATLSISINPLAFTDQDPLAGAKFIFFVQGPRFYKQVNIPSTNGTGSLTTPTITVPSALAGVYEIGAVAAWSQAGNTFEVTLSGTPLVTSSLGGGLDATSFSVSGINSNEQGVSTFVYRNGLIP